MNRLVELKNAQAYQPLVADVLKTLTILLVVELMLWSVNKDPLMDKVFVRLTLYNLLGIIMYHMVVDKVIGVGKGCECPFPKVSVQM